MKTLDFFRSWWGSSHLQENPLIRSIKENEKQGNTFIFRPRSLWEFIGQERVKERIYKYIKAVRERNLIFPHTLICGEPGQGKTTLAKVIANELEVRFIECIASDLDDIENIKEKIVVVNGGVFFQDEIHSLPRDMSEKMYPLMEDFQYGGIPIKPFTLIGATTEVGELLDNRKPFYDRFRNIVELEEYKKKDLIKIGEQYKEKIFSNDKFEKENYVILASNCRGNPRALIRLMEAIIFFNGSAEEVLYNFGIIKDGYTEKDYKTLKYISSNERGVGLQGIANYLGTYSRNYIYDIEPYLLKNGLIVRTAKGRKITEKGIKVLNELEKIKGEI